MSTYNKYDSLIKLYQKAYPSKSAKNVQLDVNEVWKSRIKEKKKINDEAYEDFVQELNVKIQKHIETANRNKITNFIKKKTTPSPESSDLSEPTTRDITSQPSIPQLESFIPIKKTRPIAKKLETSISTNKPNPNAKPLKSSIQFTPVPNNVKTNQSKDAMEESSSQSLVASPTSPEVNNGMYHYFLCVLN